MMFALLHHISCENWKQKTNTETFTFCSGRRECICRVPTARSLLKLISNRFTAIINLAPHNQKKPKRFLPIDSAPEMKELLARESSLAKWKWSTRIKFYCECKQFFSSSNCRFWIRLYSRVSKGVFEIRIISGLSNEKYSRSPNSKSKQHL